MFEANKEIITDYYARLRDEMVKDFENVYFKGDVSFRGARHV